MCSAAWNFREGGYELAFNRDESWARPSSAHPVLEKSHPIPGACARDPAGGGTWLFTNENGVTLAVMNAYPGGKIPPPGVVSRGELPLQAGLHRNPGEHLVRIDWKNFAPCKLLLIAADGVRHFGWDGENFHAHPTPPRNFLTTSSIRTAAVRQARQARFDEISGLPIGKILDDTVAEDPAAALFVTREDGGTVSRTSVIVSPQAIRFAVMRRGESERQIHFPRKS